MSIRPIQQLTAETMSLNLKLNRLNINMSKQNQIKVNRKKLPFDFFSKNSERSERSYSKDRINQDPQQLLTSKRQFNSERKIITTKNMNQFQNYHDSSLKRQMTAFNNQRVMAKVFKLKLDKDFVENDKKKGNKKHQVKTFRFQKKINDLDMYEQGLASNQFCNFKSKQFSNIIAKDMSSVNRSKNNSNQNPQILDMNCTFGKKFNKSISSPPNFSLQNTIDLKQSKQIQEQIQRESKFQQQTGMFQYERQRKQKQDRSTEESSQIFYQLSKIKRVTHTSQKCSIGSKFKQTQYKCGKLQQKRHKTRRNSLLQKGINLPRILDRQDKLIQF